MPSVISTIAGAVRQGIHRLRKTAQELTRKNPLPIRAIYDGVKVDDLCAHIWKIVKAVREEREEEYREDGGWRARCVACDDWYKGFHWQNAPSKGGKRERNMMKANGEYMVENHIAGTTDGMIVPALIQGQPTIAVAPHDGGDLEAAALLNAYLRRKLQENNFEQWNIEISTDMPTFGRGVWHSERRFDRNEPSGATIPRDLDPMAVAWIPANRPIEEARVIVHVELWDTAEAQTQFGLMQMRDPVLFEEMPSGHERNAELDWWNLDHWIHQRDRTPTAKLFPQTLIAKVWIRDSERVSFPREETVTEPVPDDYQPKEGEQIQEQQVPHLAKQDPLIADQLPPQTKSQKYRVVKRQVMDSEVDKETGKTHQFPVFDTEPVYPNWRLTIIAGEDYLVYDGHNPHKHGDIPYGQVLWRKDGAPLAAILKDQQAGINRGLTQIAGHAKRAGDPASLIIAGILPAGKLKTINTPGEVIEVKLKDMLDAGVTSLDGTVRQLDLGDLNPSVTQNYRSNLEAFERLSGVSEVSVGFANASDSGAKVQNLDQKSIRRLEIPATYNDISLKRLGKHILWDCWQWDDRREMARLSIDPDDPMASSVAKSLKDIFGNSDTLKFDIELQATMGGGMTPRQARQQRAMREAPVNPAAAAAAGQLTDEPLARGGPGPAPMLGGGAPPVLGGGPSPEPKLAPPQ